MKLLLSLILIIISGSAQDEWEDQQRYPGIDPSQHSSVESQPQLTERFPSTLSKAAPFIFVGLATPVLAYVSVKAGSSMWVQSTGVAQTINDALKRFVSFYPNAPRNIFALLVSWGVCSTVGLIKASNLNLALYFSETER